ncbi:MAG: winged helix-turn-helix domain-containing protein [Acidithiobacillus sp.]|nr:winged helix-turn-helix domain-containing protein [Acidithiobacillus sp.]
MFISRLRRIVETDPGDPRYIQTVWGRGYVLVPDGGNAAAERDET